MTLYNHGRVLSIDVNRRLFSHFLSHLSKDRFLFILPVMKSSHTLTVAFQALDSGIRIENQRTFMRNWSIA